MSGAFTGDYQYFRDIFKLRLLEIPNIKYVHFITDINDKSLSVM